MTGSVAVIDSAFVFSGFNGAVAFQGNRPVCLPVAISIAHQIERGPGHTALSPEALWTSIVRTSGAGLDGATASEADAALSGDGQPQLTAWPFDETITYDGHSQPPSALAPPPWLTGSLQPVPMLHDGAEGPILGVLQEGKPLVLIIETTDDFTFPIDGLVAVPPAGAGDGAFHAVAVIGAARTIDGTPWLRIRNSWGEDWGQDGCCWLPLDYLRTYGNSTFTVTPG